MIWPELLLLFWIGALLDNGFLKRCELEIEDLEGLIGE